MRRLIAALALFQAPIAAAETPAASEATRRANAAVAATLPADAEDEDFASRGFIASWPEATIKDDRGRIVWDFAAYDFATGAAPETANPSLWRHARLLARHGLFKAHERVYQVRGFDASNMSIVLGDNGLIIVDPLASVEVARAGLALARKHLGERPVLAVIYTHSHADHFAGARGVVGPEDLKKGRVRIIAPEGFLEHSVSENVIAGPAMGRRAAYQFGSRLSPGPAGQLTSGIGLAVSAGTRSLIPPTEIIGKTGETLTIDGVKFVFQLTPETEAPAEMNFFLPQFGALCLAENANASMHNVLTPRGALVRDSKRWADHLTEALRMFGADAELVFASHAWPRFGGDRVRDYVASHRDAYKYLHDQTVRLMNNGRTGEEIAEEIALPKALEGRWFNRGYYGTMRHNSRAVYQRYMGWYSGNPSDLDNLPPEMVGPKYIEFMGGEQEVLKKAKASLDKGEYRWVAEVLKHLVFANPNNTEGKLLLADALEQLGYQAESGPWRSVYLQGAYELRNGVPNVGGTVTASPDTIRAMSPSMLFDYLSVRINPEKAAGKKMVINMAFTDIEEKHTLSLENSVLNHTTRYAAKPDVTITLSKKTLDDIQLGQGTMEQKIANGEIKIEGDQQTFSDFVTLLDKFNFWFNIVTP